MMCTPAKVRDASVLRHSTRDWQTDGFYCTISVNAPADATTQQVTKT
jgi:hypothetical protein